MIILLLVAHLLYYISVSLLMYADMVNVISKKYPLVSIKKCLLFDSLLMIYT